MLLEAPLIRDGSDALVRADTEVVVTLGADVLLGFHLFVIHQ